jgi:hypothetical protein
MSVKYCTAYQFYWLMLHKLFLSYSYKHSDHNNYVFTAVVHLFRP